MVSGVLGANGRSVPNHVALVSQKGNDSATTHHLKMTADLVSGTVKKHGDAYGSIVPQVYNSEIPLCSLRKQSRFRDTCFLSKWRLVRLKAIRGGEGGGEASQVVAPFRCKP